jgi:imidazolonepropionase-like amidohydrolase
VIGTARSEKRSLLEDPVTTPPLHVRGARIADVEAGTYVDDDELIAVDGRIVDRGRGLTTPEGARVVEAGGAALVPGLIDAHVHITAATADLASLPRWVPSYVHAHTSAIVAGMLDRGFTTVRDASGADSGFARAQQEGLLRGPRILFCGKALSQTGGHGDPRSVGDQDFDNHPCCAGIGRVADGVDAVRAAARDELRRGANHLKVMAGGGITSPTDRIDSTQYSIEELTAIVEEATAVNRYVMAHAYTPRAIERALRSGVRSIEHGNLADQESVDLLLEKEAFLVPTLVAYWALALHGRDLGLPSDFWEKLATVRAAGETALANASAAGVKIAFGSDLLGPLHGYQAQEFTIRSQVQPSIEVLRGATTVAAQLVGMAGEIGTTRVGALADLLLVAGDPIEDVNVLAEPNKYLRAVIQGGAIVAEGR